MVPDAHAALLNAVAQDLSIFPHQYNPVAEKILLVRLNVEDQTGAAFLDQRVLKQNTQGAWFSVDSVERSATDKSANFAAAPQGFIFHVGHCGSTLVSRLVAAATDSQALREPLPLRTLAMDNAEGPAGLLGRDGMAGRLSLFERLWARGARASVVKATSICSDLIDVVAADARKVFLYQRPQTHLAVVLAGANSMTDLKGFAQLRYKRLARHCDLGVLSGFGAGELAALAWLTETITAGAARQAISVFDFDDILSAPERALGEICDALGFETPPGQIAAAVSGPIMRAYSKAPEHGYDADLRQQVIAQSERENAAEIKAGMVWLDKLAADQPIVAQALEHFASSL